MKRYICIGKSTAYIGLVLFMVLGHPLEGPRTYPMEIRKKCCNIINPKSTNKEEREGQRKARRGKKQGGQSW